MANRNLIRLALSGALLAAPAVAQEDIRTVSLKVHNDRRAAAGVVPAMQWDADLAAGAQGWADRQRVEAAPVHATAPVLPAGVAEHMAWGSQSDGGAPTIEATERKWYTSAHNDGINKAGNARLGCGTSVGRPAGTTVDRRMVVCWLAPAVAPVVAAAAAAAPAPALLRIQNGGRGTLPTLSWNDGLARDAAAMLDWQIAGSKGPQPTLTAGAATNAGFSATGMTDDQMMQQFVTDKNPNIVTAGRTQTGCATALAADGKRGLRCSWK